MSPEETPVTIEIVEAGVDEEGSNCKGCISCFAKLGCCCKCCGNGEVRAARKDLSGIITDWLIDASVATYHILFRNDPTAGILTYAIVFHAGLIITFSNLVPSKHNKTEVRLMKSEIWKISPFYGVLMYIPSFFPICSGKLRLEFAKRLRDCELCRTENTETEIAEIRQKMKIFKEKALWDSCCEAFFEAFPQAVLQIVLILMPRPDRRSPFEYFPLVTVFLGLYGITGAPIQVLTVRDKNLSWNIVDKLAAYASNALRVFSSALFIVAILTFTKSETASTLTNTLWITLAAVIIFGLMAGLYIIKYEIDRCLQKPGNHPIDDVDGKSVTLPGADPAPVSTFRKKCPDTVISILGLVITIVSFYFWVSSQIYPLGVIYYDTGAVIGFYVILMVLTCIGIAVGRRKLALYHEIVADIPVSAYKRVKSWIWTGFRKLFCPPPR